MERGRDICIYALMSHRSLYALTPYPYPYLHMYSTSKCARNDGIQRAAFWQVLRTLALDQTLIQHEPLTPYATVLLYFPNECLWWCQSAFLGSEEFL
jgi:hypothetical protein